MEHLSRQGWSGVTEVANALDIHKSTAYRLLTTLRDRGLVEQDASSEKYRLGFGIVLLASSVRADLDILRCARPICESLSEETQETVTMAVPDGADAVIVHQTISRSSALNVDWQGQHTPLHATAAGKLLLLHMPASQRGRILKKPLERFTENTIVDPNLLEEHLREIPELGYSYTIEELEEGLNAVGAEIWAADGGLAGAITLSGPAFRMPVDSLEEAGRLTREAATEISRCLGFRV